MTVFLYFYHIFKFRSYLLIRQLGFMEGYMYKKIFFIISFIIASCFLYNSTFATSSSYIWSNMSDISSMETTSENDIDLGLESGGAILIEQSTGTVLYQHNAHEAFRPASVTKVMSLLLIMESIDNRRNFFR